GVEMEHIPYNGSAPALTDLVAGRQQAMFAAGAAAAPFVKEGKLRALAVTTSQPSASAPESPTVAASAPPGSPARPGRGRAAAALPGCAAMPWLGLVAPAGTPPAAIDVIYGALDRILRRDEVKRKFADLGLDIIGSDPQTFAAFIKQDIGTWAKVARDSDIR